MKKVFVLLMFILTICSSAFAECNLDMNRWKHLATSDICAFYFDTVSLDVNKANSSFEVWQCQYYPGNISNCSLGYCKNSGLQNSEHYHLILVEFNYEHRTTSTKRIIVQDANHKNLSSYDYPLNLQQPKKIQPDTYLESFMIKIKDYIDNPTSSKSGAKEPLFPIVINNAKREDVQKEIYLAFKDFMAAPFITGRSPVISEDNEKRSLKYIWKENGISFEGCWNTLVTKQGKNVIVNGEANVTSHYPDGKTVGPIRKPDAEYLLFLLINRVKINISGYYRFGYDYNKNAEGYYVISKVVPGYPFEKKGIKVGDILISINGNQLKGLSTIELDIKKILDPFSPDEKIFEIKHNGETKQYTIKPKFVTPEELKKETKS